MRDTSAGHPSIVRGPAAWAAMRWAGAGALLGTLGIGSALLVVLRLLESWRLGPGAVANTVSIGGAHLSYPTANAAGIAVLGEALLGLAVLVAGARAAVGEMRAARRFGQWVRTCAEPARDDVTVIDHQRPVAFCAGLLRPRIYVSTAAVGVLDQRALLAVLDHERAHCRRYDPLRLSVARVLSRALFFAPGFRRLTAEHESLAELSADEYAVGGSAQARRALARAMLAFDEHPGAPQGAGIDPARADALCGQAQSWKFPVLACVPAVAALAVMILTATLIGRLAVGAATLGVPFLSGQPCVLMLALAPALLGLGVLRLTRRPDQS